MLRRMAIHPSWAASSAISTQTTSVRLVRATIMIWNQIFQIQNSRQPMLLSAQLTTLKLMKEAIPCLQKPTKP